MTVHLTEEQLNDSVTQHMRREFSRLKDNQTVGEALESIRAHPIEGRIIYFYVLDDEGRLQGVVPTRRLLLSPLDMRIADIMIRQVVAIPAEATVLDACEFFTMHRLLAFPVVDQDRRMIGIVDVEMYTDELSELADTRASDDLFQLVGVHVTAARQTSPFASFRNRFPWLLCNIGAGILAALLAGLYEDEIKRAVALALFIPVVLALSEGVTIQSVSLSLQVMQGQRPTWTVFLRRLRAELLTGILLGVASGIIVALVAAAWIGKVSVALCVLGGIAGGMAGATAFGLILPHLLRLLRRDPQVAAGPIALAAADVFTLLIYFNLARWLLAG